jgi:hypothetical protein
MAGDRRIAATESLGRDDGEDARGQQTRVRLEQHLDPPLPVLVDEQLGAVGLPLRWRAAGGNPLRDRGREIAELVGDLGDGESFVPKLQHVHVPPGSAW